MSIREKILLVATLTIANPEAAVFAKKVTSTDASFGESEVDCLGGDGEGCHGAGFTKDRKQ